MRAYLCLVPVLATACSSSSSSSGDAGNGSPPDAAIDTGGGGLDSSSLPDTYAADSGGGGESGGGLQVGDPCTSTSQCPSISLENGSCMTNWPGGGACTIVGCGMCPGNASCTVYVDNQTYCAPPCIPGGTPCTRPGYACYGGGCLPALDAGDGG